MAQPKPKQSAKPGRTIELAALGRRAKKIPRTEAVSVGGCRGSLNCDRVTITLEKFVVKEIGLLAPDGDVEDRFFPPFNKEAEQAALAALRKENPNFVNDRKCQGKRCKCEMGRVRIELRRRLPGYVGIFQVPGLGRSARAVGSARVIVTYRPGRCVNI